MRITCSLALKTGVYPTRLLRYSTQSRSYYCTNVLLLYHILGTFPPAGDNSSYGYRADIYHPVWSTRSTTPRFIRASRLVDRTSTPHPRLPGKRERERVCVCVCVSVCVVDVCLWPRDVSVSVSEVCVGSLDRPVPRSPQLSRHTSTGASAAWLRLPRSHIPLGASRPGQKQLEGARIGLERGERLRRTASSRRKARYAGAWRATTGPSTPDLVACSHKDVPLHDP